MENLSSNYEAIAKAVEAIPVGGLVTASIHVTSGNDKLAIQAVTAGVGGAVTSSTTTNGLASIMVNMGINDAPKTAVTALVNKSNNEKSKLVLVDKRRMKVSDNYRKYSRECGGQRTLKSVYGTFLRAYDKEWKVEMSHYEGSREHWYIEDHGGMVVFKAIHCPGRFLRCRSDGRVVLVDRLMQEVYWTPFENDDGSWSFSSVYESWLCATDDRSVVAVEYWNLGEQFSLGRW